MDKVEKFKELLEEYANSWYLCCAYDLNTKKDSTHKNKKYKLINKMVKLEKELIKMYDEKQEKPVIMCKKYKVNYIGEENCIGQMQDRYEIHWQGKNCWQLNTSEQIEEKENMLITDDFIQSFLFKFAIKSRI